MKKYYFVGLFVGVLLMSFIGTVKATPISVSDGFEGTQLDSYWTIYSQDYGSVSLSADQSRSGQQSLMLSAPGSYYYIPNRTVYLGHHYNQFQEGSVSVWFYDTAPGQETLYSHIYLTRGDWGSSSIASLGVQDWIGSKYMGAPGIQDHVEDWTNISRTSGWHLFQIDASATGATAYIDGNAISASHTGDYRFDTVVLQLSGPGWRPGATYYYDDFKITSAPTPEPATILLFGTGIVGIASRKFRRQRA
jgi:hypothetical protein